MSNLVLWILWILLCIPFDNVQSKSSMITQPPISCRINLGNRFPMETSTISTEYKVETCVSCFSLLYKLEFQTNSSIIIDKQAYTLDTQNQSSIEDACVLMRDKDISIGVETCVTNVMKCCKAAEECCMKQIKQIINKADLGDDTVPYCPTTWDGINCIDRVAAGTVANALCPSYVPNFSGLNRATKMCDDSGNWALKYRNGSVNEPTNYTNCFPIYKEITICYASIVSLSISILFLIVSTSLFLSFRSLRKQKRIQIHINLFIALLLKSLLELISKIVIDLQIYDQFTRNGISPFNFMLQNGCEWISILVRYFQNCSFCWMLCEAIFLDFLLFHAFRIVSGIKQYMVIGWVIPLIYTSIYVIIRWIYYPNKDSKAPCWVDDVYYAEYINRCTNILSLCINVGLLYRIICLIRKLPRQNIEGNDERNNWGYTLKAVLVLVPLFGLHLLLVAIPVPSNSPYHFVYGLIQTIIQSSEGTAVSLAFCVFNQEVRTTIIKRVNLASHDAFLPPFNSVHQRHSNRSSHRSISSVSRHTNSRISNNSTIKNAIPLLERHSRKMPSFQDAAKSNKTNSIPTDQQGNNNS